MLMMLIMQMKVSHVAGCGVRGRDVRVKYATRLIKP